MRYGKDRFSWRWPVFALALCAVGLLAIVKAQSDRLEASFQSRSCCSSAERREVLAQAVRELHRNLLLHPRQASRDFQEYAVEGVDVLLLAENAKAQSGELHALAPDAIHNVLAEYERELDALLLRQAAAHRDGKLARKIATIEKDTAAIRDLDQAALTRWKELYQLNLRAVRQIGDIAASSLGEDARRKWLDRFDQASFTWLYPRRRPDRQIDWIRQQSLPADPREQAEATYENYLNRRRELSRQAIDIMLRARLEFQTMVYSMMDPASIDDGASRGLYEELLKNSGEQANLDSITAAALETLLNSTQREAMRKALQGPDPASRR